MDKGGDKGGDKNRPGKQTPAEARRQRLAASLRSNLRRRKDQGRNRAGADEAAGPDKGRDQPDDEQT
jgi:hypothetical protein